MSCSGSAGECSGAVPGKACRASSGACIVELAGVDVRVWERPSVIQRRCSLQFVHIGRAFFVRQRRFLVM